eukprot:3798859-Pyramimonas_sp.AAC.1
MAQHGVEDQRVAHDIAWRGDAPKWGVSWESCVIPCGQFWDSWAVLGPAQSPHPSSPVPT